MELLNKLDTLTASARYDVSCVSSGSSRQNTGGMGCNVPGGICHSWSADGRCVSLLKVLFTNFCVYDCAYCINRESNDTRRASFTPQELADLTINFYRRNYIEGLFLSSGIIKNPDYTMELLIETARLLRRVHRFNGYLHMKIIPDADPLLVHQAGMLADRVSVNIELPTRESLSLLAPSKTKDAILKPMSQIKNYMVNKTPAFAPAGQSTQIIVGATPDSDLQIIRLTEGLYTTYKLRRVFFSAYTTVNHDARLPELNTPPLLREHRLYQADWLLRFYGFKAGELLDSENPYFDTRLDPKSEWAIRNLHLFPVEINQADKEMLLRIPGIGYRSVRRILKARKVRELDEDHLKRLGIVLKRARHFITVKGRYLGDSRIGEENIISKITTSTSKRKKDYEQLSLFSSYKEAVQKEDVKSSITGEI